MIRSSILSAGSLSVYLLLSLFLFSTSPPPPSPSPPPSFCLLTKMQPRATSLLPNYPPLPPFQCLSAHFAMRIPTTLYALIPQTDTLLAPPYPLPSKSPLFNFSPALPSNKLPHPTLLLPSHPAPPTPIPLPSYPPSPHTTPPAALISSLLLPPLLLPSPLPPPFIPPAASGINP